MTDTFPTPATVEDARRDWAHVEARWTATTARALRLPESALYERVNDEWSFVETLRHLVFATDSWLRKAVLGDPTPCWWADLPHSSFADDLSALGIDPDAAPTFAEAQAVRADRWAQIRAFLASCTQGDFARSTPNVPYDFPDDASFTIRDCVSTIIEEEWLHCDYATRDLDVLLGRTGQRVERLEGP